MNGLSQARALVAAPDRSQVAPLHRESRVAGSALGMVRLVARYGYVPLMLIGINGLAFLLVLNGAPLWIAGALALPAIGLTFLMERVLPYRPGWNEPHADLGAGTAHALVYELANLGATMVLPLIIAVIPWTGFWPRHWPLWCQLAAAVLVADLGMTTTHVLSHRVSWLWRLHAVHHGVTRLYGLNGLVRHPLHQQLDLIVGTLPLALAGMPLDVAVLLGLAVTVQLVLQHSNVDYRLGPLRLVLAIGAAHRLHHVNWPGEGDINFGLFLTLWDRALGTFRLASSRVPGPGDIGIQDQPRYPQAYLAQLVAPFRPE
jgi:sterol desaturase/sphingolipid hydroxylase (fatty acid hydroxylase superfamily)